MFFFCVFPYISSAISVQSCEPGTIGSFFFDLSSTKFPGKTTVFFCIARFKRCFKKILMKIHKIEAIQAFFGDGCCVMSTFQG